MCIRDRTDFEPPALTLNGQTLTPTQCEWHAPVLNGVLYKTYAPAASPRQDLGEIGQATVPLSPVSYTHLDVYKRQGPPGR